MKIKQSKCWFGDSYLPGDIVGLEPNGWSILEARASQAVFTPHTPRLHWFFIAKYLPGEKDYVIIESIPDGGVRIGRLSWYDGQKYQVFRIAGIDPATGQRIIDEASLFGRRQYGYLSIIKMLPAIIAIEWANWKIHRRLRSVTARDMYIHMSDKGLLCTQLVFDVPKALGIDILLPGDAPLPCAFISAIDAGLLKEVTQQTGRQR